VADLGLQVMVEILVRYQNLPGLKVVGGGPLAWVLTSGNRETKCIECEWYVPFLLKARPTSSSYRRGKCPGSGLPSFRACLFCMLPSLQECCP
jgi:hypothetical protein